MGPAHVVNARRAGSPSRTSPTRDAAGKVVRWTAPSPHKRCEARCRHRGGGFPAWSPSWRQARGGSGQRSAGSSTAASRSRQCAMGHERHRSSRRFAAHCGPLTRAISSGEPYELMHASGRFRRPCTAGTRSAGTPCGRRRRDRAMVLRVFISTIAGALSKLWRASESRLSRLVELNAGGFWDRRDFRYLPTTFLHLYHRLFERGRGSARHAGSFPATSRPCRIVGRAQSRLESARTSATSNTAASGRTVGSGTTARAACRSSTIRGSSRATRRVERHHASASGRKRRCRFPRSAMHLRWRLGGGSFRHRSAGRHDLRFRAP